MDDATREVLDGITNRELGALRTDVNALRDKMRSVLTQKSAATEWGKGIEQEVGAIGRARQDGQVRLDGRIDDVLEEVRQLEHRIGDRGPDRDTNATLWGAINACDQNDDCRSVELKHLRERVTQLVRLGTDEEGALQARIEKLERLPIASVVNGLGERVDELERNDHARLADAGETLVRAGVIDREDAPPMSRGLGHLERQVEELNAGHRLTVLESTAVRHEGRLHTALPGPCTAPGCTTPVYVAGAATYCADHICMVGDCEEVRTGRDYCKAHEETGDELSKTRATITADGWDEWKRRVKAVEWAAERAAHEWRVLTAGSDRSTSITSMADGLIELERTRRLDADRCQVCGCSDHKPCIVSPDQAAAVGCGWANEDRDVCTRCEALVERHLGILGNSVVFRSDLAKRRCLREVFRQVMLQGNYL